MMTRKKYDVITADLILPVHAGANHLYSLEYFELVRCSLNEDGVPAPVAVRERSFRAHSLLVRTFLPGVSRCDRLGRRHPVRRFAGGHSPFPATPSSASFRISVTRLGLQSVGLGSFEALTSQFVAGPDTLRRYVGDGPYS